jgi:polyisoprenoid-binding protein YceI
MLNKAKTIAFATLVLASGFALAATQWTLQPGSKLSFIAKQAGAEFEAVFDKFTADIKFDPKDLAGSRFDVTIEMASVNSKDAERDTELKTPALFDTRKFPTARFVADKFSDKGGGKFAATGKLTIRDVTKDTPIEFTFTEKGDTATLSGGTTIKRLDFGVGQGEWKDTSGVPNDVRVRFTLQLKK